MTHLTPRRLIVSSVLKALSVFGPAPAMIIAITPAEVKAMMAGRPLAVDVCGTTVDVTVEEID